MYHSASHNLWTVNTWDSRTVQRAHKGWDTSPSPVHNCNPCFFTKKTLNLGLPAVNILQEDAGTWCGQERNTTRLIGTFCLLKIRSLRQYNGMAGLHPVLRLHSCIMSTTVIIQMDSDCPVHQQTRTLSTRQHCRSKMDTHCVSTSFGAQGTSFYKRHYGPDSQK